jgi:hypothetical protein
MISRLRSSAFADRLPDPQAIKGWHMLQKGHNVHWAIFPEHQ